MGFKEIISRFGQKSRERKEMLSQLHDRMRMQKLAEDRFKSANERELEGYIDEDREAEIKEHLEYMRKKRRDEIAFGHNPINTKNIMKAEWEIMKEKNQFSKKSNMFEGQKSVLKSNRNLLKNNKKLLSGGNLFKI